MRTLLAAFTGLAVALGCASLAHAQAIGKVRTVSGDAAVVRGAERLPAVVGTEVRQSDVIETGADGSVGIAFMDNSVISAGPGTRLALEEFTFNTETMQGSFLSRLSRGTMSVSSGDIARGSPDAMKVRTPSAILGVRGTRFLVRAGQN